MIFMIGLDHETTLSFKLLCFQGTSRLLKNAFGVFRQCLLSGGYVAGFAEKLRFSATC
jgi:hypothetical protein